MELKAMLLLLIGLIGRVDSEVTGPVNQAEALTSLSTKVCSGSIKGLITPDDKSRIVAFLNDKRRALQKSNMFEVTWDDDLADLAEGFSRACIFGHGMMNRCDKTDTTGRTVMKEMFGQNSAYSMGKGSTDFETVLKGWFSEKPLFDESTNRCTELCGHYRQMMYSQVTKVGCALKYCPDGVYDSKTGTSKNGGTVVVCNFDWFMPKEEVSIFESKGDACSTCIGHTDDKQQLTKYITCNKGLCNFSQTCSAADGCPCNKNKLICNGNGTPSGPACNCVCDKGYKGDKCQHICFDNDPGYCEVVGFMCEENEVALVDCPNTCKDIYPKHPCKD
ncbi:cysteine-rich venom protein Mr30-like isoform X2 [Tubulanus polymorphus]|uniref:cysteine-rich venom protein Mr30-like isoform X2 n=1 Tax=Tubulanus polymorphus TaxID=672921 RepID=UPI003DA59980